jgi:hypothetical protein
LLKRILGLASASGLLLRPVRDQELGVARVALGYYSGRVQTLTIKLEPEQDAWLTRQAKALKRSKGGIIRDLIQQQQTGKDGSLGQALADLCGCLHGSKDLSTRRLKGYGRS